jgi:hypothetical protein
VVLVNLFVLTVARNAMWADPVTLLQMCRRIHDVAPDTPGVDECLRKRAEARTHPTSWGSRSAPTPKDGTSENVGPLKSGSYTT